MLKECLSTAMSKVAWPSEEGYTLCRTKVKARVETAYGEWVERIPAWIKWATQVRIPCID